MKRNSQINPAQRLKLQEDSKRIKINNAPNTLVAGHNNIPVLEDINSYFFANWFNRHELIGIIEVTPEDKDLYGYYTLDTTNPVIPNVSLAYLLDNVAPNFLEAPELFNDFLTRHPVIVYFPGCDDGSVARVFKTPDDAKDFVKNLVHFGELFENPWSAKDIAVLAKTEPQDQLDCVMKEHLFYIN